ncbi:hypothetical protein EYR41_009773 [Orbilia oligospora]|uniref:Uncharacterized protein n=1 Tax=Orbilia oligospora TaxID=2813651 RepID=A0A8H2DXR8_ORBOL|nr:hypothetical protein EYR41_009773 [Orbilia oligospora]
MSLDAWTEWIVSNAPTFRSIGEQIDFFKEVHIAQLGLENMETVRKEQWTPNGMIETPSAKFVHIELWLKTISESMLSGPVNLTGPNMVEERAWGLGKFMTSMEMPSKEIPFVKVDLNAPPHILGELESFRKDMRQSTYNANNWNILARKFGFDHPFFGKYINEEPFKYDPDFGYRAVGKEVTLSNLFDYFLACQERLAEPKKEEEMECLKHEDSVKVGWPEGKIEVKKAEDETKPYVPFRAEDYKASIPKVEDVGGGLQERRPNWETWGNEIVLEEADDPVPQIPSLYKDQMEEEF